MCSKTRKSYFRRNQKGFTLLELLVTVAIVALLVSLATSGYDVYKRRAALAVAKATASTAYSMVKSYMQGVNLNVTDTGNDEIKFLNKGVKVFIFGPYAANNCIGKLEPPQGNFSVGTEFSFAKTISSSSSKNNWYWGCHRARGTPQGVSPSHAYFATYFDIGEHRTRLASTTSTSIPIPNKGAFHLGFGHCFAGTVLTKCDDGVVFRLSDTKQTCTQEKVVQSMNIKADIYDNADWAAICSY